MEEWDSFSSLLICISLEEERGGKKEDSSRRFVVAAAAATPSSYCHCCRFHLLAVEKDSEMRILAE